MDFFFFPFKVHVDDRWSSYWTCKRGHDYTASSIGLLLKACGLHVTSIKIGLCFELIFLLFFG